MSHGHKGRQREAIRKMDTPETRTCIRLLKQGHGQGGDAHAVKLFVKCMQQLHTMAGLTLDDAARLVKRELPQTAFVVMDRIGLHPSSEPELAALQRVWP